MARNRTGPRYWQSRGGWYTTLNGRQILLAPGPRNSEMQRKALEEFLKITSCGVPPRSSILVSELVDSFLEQVRPGISTESRRSERTYLGVFRAAFGHHLSSDLSRTKVRLWIDTTDRWCESTRCLVAGIILRPFNWAVEVGILRENPLRGLMQGLQVQSRVKEAGFLFTEEVHQKLLGIANEPMRNLLLALNGTGARPKELIDLEASMYSPSLHAFLPAAWKTKKSTPRQRIIYLPESLEKLCLELMKKGRSRVFTNRSGKPWKIETIDAWFEKKRKLLGLGRITPYLYRHKFCSEFLLRGGRMFTLASLLGTSVRIIEKHYSHIGEYHQELRSEVCGFRT